MRNVLQSDSLWRSMQHSHDNAAGDIVDVSHKLHTSGVRPAKDPSVWEGLRTMDMTAQERV